MKINVSNVIRDKGSSLSVELKERIEQLDTLSRECTFDEVDFLGVITNISGILKLDGGLKVSYSSNCSKCLGVISGVVDIKIDEEFIFSENPDEGVYTYKGWELSLDKALIDNIILNLPVRQACKSDCKGLCHQCGVNLNEDLCKCEQDINASSFEALEKLFLK